MVVKLIQEHQQQAQYRGSMKKKENSEPTNGVLTDRMDVNSIEFDEFQAILLNKSRTHTDRQKINVELIALRVKMEDYINATKADEFKLAGDFLRSYLDILNIRQNKFANYIGIEPSTLSKVIKGERPINSEIALIFGKIFGIDPMLWLEIQAKNELTKLESKKSKSLEKYSLEDLIEQSVG